MSTAATGTEARAEEPKKDLTNVYIFLVILVVLVLGFLLYKHYGKKSETSSAVGAAVGGFFSHGGLGDYVVAAGGDTEHYDGENDTYDGGAAKKKEAKAEKAEKSDKEGKKSKKTELVSADDDEAEEMVELAKEDAAESAAEPRKDGERTGFRGHFLSERVVEKHNPETDKVTTYRVSVRGSMKDTHRVVVKIKELTEGNVQEKNGRMRKLKLRGTSSGEYEVNEKKEKNVGSFTAEEKEPAIRLLHGALNSSMLDESTREKIVKLVEEKL
jgi:hypothetical protein